MKSNAGGIDRVLRIVVGIVLIALAATETVGWWGWLGVVPLLTGLVQRPQHSSRWGIRRRCQVRRNYSTSMQCSSKWPLRRSEK